MEWYPQEDLDVTDTESSDSSEIDQFSYDHVTLSEFDDEPINVVTACIIPALIDTTRELILPIFVSSLVLQCILTLLQWRNTIRHEYGKFISLIVGVALLAFHFRLQFELFVLSLIAYGFASIMYIKFRFSPWYICGLIILINEIFSFHKLNFMRIRMHLMLLLMKMVSFEDEVSVKKQKKPDQPKNSNINLLLDLLCNLFHPSSILLNSWHPRKTILVNLSGHSLRSLLSMIKSLAISLIFLLLSSCFIHVFIEDYVNGFLGIAIYSLIPSTAANILHKLLWAHCIALQFRCSHYFICYLTEASFKLWQMDNSTICSAGQVEVPRSLVEVVIAWNIPMHNWLKKFVFFKLKNKHNVLLSIIGTYFISSFMHGLNFQIWSVLLSLGTLTFLEDRIRYKLSCIFSCCIMSRACKKRSDENGDCTEGHANQNGMVVFSINLFFTFLALIHLAFLGSTFDGSETSSHASNVIQVWSDLAFYSHIIAFITLVIYCVI